MMKNLLLRIWAYFFQNKKEDDTPNDLVYVPGHKFLCYSSSTRYVYCVGVDGEAEFWCKYQTPAGNFAKYRNGKIIDVVTKKYVDVSQYG